MHEHISLTELLHQCCTRFNSITLTKLMLPLFQIRKRPLKSRFYLGSCKRNSYVHVNITASFSKLKEKSSHYENILRQMSQTYKGKIRQVTKFFEVRPALLPLEEEKNYHPPSSHPIALPFLLHGIMLFICQSHG